MANIVLTQVLLDNSHQYVAKLTIVGDGSGEETLTLMNYVSGDMGTNNILDSIISCLSGFSASVWWDATTDVMVCQLPSDSQVNLNFYGLGIRNNAGAGKTGDLKITTSGLGSGDSGYVVFKVNKN